MVGDATCLESIAEQVARRASAPDAALREWHASLVAAGRAIAARERLTRRHAVMRKIARTSPDTVAALVTPGAVGPADSSSETRIRKR
jgi:hypothetical protein